MIKREQAVALLEWANAQNPGSWRAHSYGVARAAEVIARACSLDAERAWVSGLLHDIGRYEGAYGLRHIFTGHQLMQDRGAPMIARICLTHSFPLPHPDAYIGTRDATDADEALLADILQTPMDDYDRLIQLCDGLSWGDGVCLMEKRIVDVIRRHGVPPPLQHTVNARFEILADFERRMEHSVYDLFPEAAENTFA
ncbi:MAG: HD domain-containing protein [Christensenellales bacterium]|jgi:hypothetical protein